jgi:hypothetical protein
MDMESREEKTTPSPYVPALFLLLLLLTHGVGAGILMARGVESPGLDYLYRAGLLWSLVWWLKADGRRRDVRQLYCLGMLTMAGGLILLPYYLFKTRGGAGLLLILAFFGALFVSGVVSVVTYAACGGRFGY